eukprot:14531503-Alexandrium_andersonii.AAC.1
MSFAPGVQTGAAGPDRHATWHDWNQPQQRAGTPASTVVEWHLADEQRSLTIARRSASWPAASMPHR